MPRVSKAAVFLDSLKGKPAATLSDHILREEKPTILADYRSLMAGCGHRLKEGGTHRDLVGTVVFGSVPKSGQPASWAGSSLREDKIEKPSWMESTEVVAVVNSVRELGLMNEKNEAFLTRIAKSGKKTFEAGFEIFRQLSEKASEEAILRHDAEQQVSILKNQMATMITEAVSRELDKRQIGHKEAIAA